VQCRKGRGGTLGRTREATGDGAGVEQQGLTVQGGHQNAVGRVQKALADAWTFLKRERHLHLSVALPLSPWLPGLP